MILLKENKDTNIKLNRKNLPWRNINHLINIDIIVFTFKNSNLALKMHRNKWTNKQM